jgi:hypothetical protein
MRLPGHEKTFELLYSCHQEFLLAIYGSRALSETTWRSLIWVGLRETYSVDQSDLLRLGILDPRNFYEFTSWVVDTRLSPQSNKTQLLAILGGLIALKYGYSLGVENIEYTIDKIGKRGLTLDARHPIGHDHSACDMAECQMWHEYLLLELFFGATWLQRVTFTRRTWFHLPHINWNGLEILLSFGADPEIALAEDEEPGQGRLIGATGETLCRTSSWDIPYKNASRVPLPWSPISLADFAQFHKPPNIDAILALIERNITRKRNRSIHVVTPPSPNLTGRQHVADSLSKVADASTAWEAWGAWKADRISRLEERLDYQLSESSESSL